AASNSGWACYSLVAMRRLRCMMANGPVLICPDRNTTRQTPPDQVPLMELRQNDALGKIEVAVGEPDRKQTSNAAIDPKQPSAPMEADIHKVKQVAVCSYFRLMRDVQGP